MYHALLLETSNIHPFETYGKLAATSFKTAYRPTLYIETIVNSTLATITLLGGDIISLVIRRIIENLFTLLSGTLQKILHKTLSLTKKYKKIISKMYKVKLPPYIHFFEIVVCMCIGALFGAHILKMITKEKQEVNTTQIMNILNWLWIAYVILLVLVATTWVKNVLKKAHTITKEVLEKMRKSKFTSLRAIAKAIDEASKYVPQLKSYKIRLLITKDEYANAFFLPTSVSGKNNLYFGLVGINQWEKHFTEEEITAVFLHELGHAITVERTNLYIRILASVAEALSYGSISGKAAILPNIVLHFFKGIWVSYRSMIHEVYADSFAVRVGYGEHLKQALEKISRINSKIMDIESEKSADYNQSNIHKYILHKTFNILKGKAYVTHLYSLETRLKMIDKEIEAAASLGIKQLTSSKKGDSNNTHNTQGSHQ